MKYKFLITLIAFLVLLSISFSVEAFEHEEIFAWVADRLGITPGEERPLIIQMGEEELKEQFLINAEKSLKRLRESMIRMGWGISETDEYIDSLVDDVAGFLTKKDGVIYIKDSLAPCYKDSIVAHEIAHFFQHKYNLMREEVREFQAIHIERSYREEHCDKGFRGQISTIDE